MYKSSVLLLSLCNTDDGLWTVTYSGRHHWCLFHQWNTHNLTNCTKFSCFIENIDFLVMIAVLLLVILLSEYALCMYSLWQWRGTIHFSFLFYPIVIFTPILNSVIGAEHFSIMNGSLLVQWTVSRFTVCQTYGLWVKLGNASSLS